jgi:ketosteroid isomerase-like protein
VSTKMPNPVATYFAAVNARDVRPFTAALAEDAIVEDEHREHHGPEEIGRWLEDAIGRYNFTVEPTHVAKGGGATTVTAIVAGDFAGSPVTLRHQFRLAGQKIVRLKIA